MGTASQELADFVQALRYDELPGDVVAAAKRHLIDAAGCALAASAGGSAGAAVDMTRSWGGARESSIIGFDFGAPAPFAAMVNGMLVHALDFDDTHIESIVHCSSVVLPAAFAVGEEVGARGAEVIAAAVVGYEIAARIGAAAPARFAVRGQSTTSIAGVIAAAAIAAKLWGLGAEETTHAIGIAGAHAGGIATPPGEGTDTKRLHPGWAAHGGIVAADLARRGATGSSSVFDALFASLLRGEDADAARVVRGLGTEWETLRVAVKPYPACHFVHACMDAGARASVKWADIEDVICFVPPSVVGIVCEPRAPRLHPATMEAAQFSLPFAVAASIVGGRDGVDLFGDEARTDRRVLTLAERIQCEADPTLPFPASYGGRVVVHTRGGRTIEIDEPVNRGHPDRPLSDQELTEKFTRNARARLETKAARRALSALQRLEEAADVATVAATLRTT